MKIENYLNDEYIAYYIKSIAEDGETIIVDTDQEIFNNRTLVEQTKLAKTYITNNFRKNDALASEIEIKVTSRTAKEYAHPRNKLNKRKMQCKMRLVPELENVLKTAKFKLSASDDGRHLFAKDGWEYYTTMFKVGNSLYTGILNIGKNGGTKILYDITQIKKASRVSDSTIEYNSSTKILDLPKNERPRERLINNGVSNLSNDELLAIILRTGTKNQSAKALASNILKILSSIQDFNNLNYETLINIKGIGPAKACDLLTVIELGKRLNQKHSIIKKIRFKNPNIIFEYYSERMQNLKQEHFYTVYLDTNKRIIKEKLLFVGTINQSLVDPLNIFKEAFLLNSKEIICVHNHPSDILIPSKNDYEATKRIKEIGDTLNIKLIDHIIIGTNNYYSFLENNDL